MVKKSLIPDAKFNEQMIQMKFGGWAKRIVQIEMKKRGLGYRELTEKLNRVLVHENERNVGNKIARGTFSAAFMLECLYAMDCKSIEIGYVADVNFEEPI